MKTIFQGKSCIAEYNPEKFRISYTFEGYPNVEEHKVMYQKAMEFLHQNKTVAFIMDFRKMKGTFSMLNDWTIDFFRPAVQIGLKKSAMVLNEDIFTAFAADDALKKVKLIQIQIFRDLEAAEQWCSE
ncbi:MAG: hypothetical protein JW801_03670 [Bacteroidales bacterium]|nr:hypothetical protein [Bacteroidales bacterium]